MNDAIGDRQKNYENEYASRKILPRIPVCARIDGRAFSQFTKGLNRPYDERLSNLMIETTKFLVGETCANVGYAQSDEISLAWYTGNNEDKTFFNRRVQKMESVLASLTAAYFMRNITKYLPEEYADRLPHFDARVWGIPTLDEAANYFLWREWDATKNSISMAAQMFFTHAELNHKNSSEKQEMLWQKGVNWNNYPSFFKRGSFLQTKKVIRKFATKDLDKLPPKHQARSNPDLNVERMECFRIEMPPFTKVKNKIGVLFLGEDPVE